MAGPERNAATGSRGATIRPSLDSILYLSSEEIRAACADLDPVAVIGRVLAEHAAGATVLPDESYLAWSPKDYSSLAGGSSAQTMARSLNMPGLVGGPDPVVGTKIINANPVNIGTGIPRAAGLTVLFDIETARPICIMEAAHISALRTASVTVLAAELLRAGPISTAALIGAGAQADAHLTLLLSHMPDLEHVSLFDRDPGRANELQGRHEVRAKGREVSLEIAGNARAAIADTDLVVTVTTTTTGYIAFEWLSPGTTLVNVSLDDPLPDVVARADILVVDDWKLICSDSRRLLGRLFRQGLVVGPDQSPPDEGRKVDATIGDLVLGRHPGRRHAGEIAIVNPFGLAIEDLALAGAIYETAAEAGIGRQLPFEG